jgi:pimeloyl-ACP methyl ester carboxylesterase
LVAPTITLDDGRALAYEQFGDRSGTPVVLFHGSPGSRLFCPGDVPEGIRLVTFDRPGYGASTPQPDRTLLDTAADVAALLDQLGIEECALVGWSGGGPHATATAFALEPRITRLAIVSAPGPLDEVPGAWDALGDYQRPTAEMARRDPARAARAVGRHMEPYLDDPVPFLGGGHVVRGPGGDMLVAQATEALRQGHAGMAADMIAMWLDWGFRLRDVTTPTNVFHGALDPHNGADAQCYATEIPDASLRIWPDDGHLGIVGHWAEVLAAVAP